MSHTSLSRTIFHTQLCQSQIIFNLSLATLSRTHIDLRFAWHAWHLWHWAGSGGALGRRWSPGALRHFAWEAWRLLTSTFGLRGRRGTVGTGLDLVARLVAVSRPTLDPPAARPAQRISRSADQRISGVDVIAGDGSKACYLATSKAGGCPSYEVSWLQFWIDRMIHTATQSRLTNYGKTPPVRVKHVISCSYKDLVFLAQEESRPRPVRRS